MRPYVQQPISKDKNVMARTRKYYSKNNYLTFRSKVKVPRRSLRYVTHHLMVMHPHTKYHWQKCYGPDKKILFKKQFFWPRGQRSRSNEGHYGMWHTALWGCTHIPNIIDLSQKKQLFDLVVKGPNGTQQCLMVMHPQTKYHWPISKDKNVMARTRKYYLKNN
jgi:hypothetical protein